PFFSPCKYSFCRNASVLQLKLIFFTHSQFERQTGRYVEIGLNLVRSQESFNYLICSLCTSPDKTDTEIWLTNGLLQIRMLQLHSRSQAGINGASLRATLHLFRLLS